jgi:hypothetical protein
MSQRWTHIIALALVFCSMMSFGQFESTTFSADEFDFVQNQKGDKLSLLGTEEISGNIVFIDGKLENSKYTANWWGVVDGKEVDGGKVIFSASGQNLVKIYSQRELPFDQLDATDSITIDFESIICQKEGKFQGHWQNEEAGGIKIFEIGKKVFVIAASGESINLAGAFGLDNSGSVLMCMMKTFGASSTDPVSKLNLVAKSGGLQNLSTKQMFDSISSTYSTSNGENGDSDDESEEDEDLEPKGASSFTTGLLEYYEYDDSDLAITDLSSVNLQIFRDANPKSGYFYFAPVGFNLDWNATNGLGIQINYLSAESGSSGKAIVQAELSNGVSPREVERISGLLQKKVNAEGEKFTSFQQLPYSSASLEIPALNLYDVQAGNVAVSIPSDALGSISLSWKMEQVDDFLAAMFSGVGLTGNLVLNCQGPIGNVSVPVAIKIDDPGTFGLLELDQNSWTSDKWKNTLPYPAVVNKVHVLVDESVEATPKFRIYTWDAGGVEVPVKGSCQFDTEGVPSWIESYNRVQSVWIDYTIPPCDYCRQSISQAIVGGTTSQRSKAVVIETINPIEHSDALYIEVRVRSVYADPKGLFKKELDPIKIESDYEQVTAGNLFVAEGDSPSFEYFLNIVMENGRTFQSDKWLEVNDYKLVLGSYQLKESVSTLPK